MSLLVRDVSEVCQLTNLLHEERTILFVIWRCPMDQSHSHKLENRLTREVRQIATKKHVKEQQTEREERRDVKRVTVTCQRTV